MAEHQPVTRPDALREIVRRLDKLERQVKSMSTRAGRTVQLDRAASSTVPSGAEGQLLIEAEGGGLRYFSNGEWRGGAMYEIKLCADNQAVVGGDGLFKFAIPHDVHSASLVFVRAYVTAVSTSGKPTVMIRNATTGHNMLSTPVTIDVSEKNSRTAAIPPVIDPSYHRVSADDEIWINVVAAGSGARGLGVTVQFA